VTDEPLTEEMPDLEALRAFIGDCHRCPLGDTRTRLVFGVGDPRAKLMFIGEAPGKNEDLQGEPFVGAAGKLLDELLASIGLTRDLVYIANILKCRPPGNRDPLPLEKETCTPFLREQIRLIAPVVIATLGNHATKYILGTETGITRLRGRLFRIDERQVLPILHPAAALYDPGNRATLFEDFGRLKSVIDRTLAGETLGTESAQGAGAPGGDAPDIVAMFEEGAGGPGDEGSGCQAEVADESAAADVAYEQQTLLGDL
jgi:uracil-DNA glycosylase